MAAAATTAATALAASSSARGGIHGRAAAGRCARTGRLHPSRFVEAAATHADGKRDPPRREEEEEEEAPSGEATSDSPASAAGLEPATSSSASDVLVAVLCGGPTAERGISLNSARSVLDHLRAPAGGATLPAPGCHSSGHVGRTGCHQLLSSTIRRARVVTPVCHSSGHVDRTGCHQLDVF
jgi:hypothetical protein